jgi:hypothetical protein
LDLAFCMIILRLCVLRLPLLRAADWSLMSVVPQPWRLPVPQVAEAVAAMYGGKRERPLPVLCATSSTSGCRMSGSPTPAGCAASRAGRLPAWPWSRFFQLAEDLTDRQTAERVRTRATGSRRSGLI